MIARGRHPFHQPEAHDSFIRQKLWFQITLKAKSIKNDGPCNGLLFATYTQVTQPNFRHCNKFYLCLLLTQLYIKPLYIQIYLIKFINLPCYISHIYFWTVHICTRESHWPRLSNVQYFVLPAKIITYYITQIYTLTKITLSAKS